jgi:hypothetical protein
MNSKSRNKKQSENKYGIITLETWQTLKESLKEIFQEKEMKSHPTHVISLKIK